MTQAANDILAAAMALDEKERAEVAERLLESIEGDDADDDAVDPGWEAASGEEVMRPMKEAEEDPSVMIPWEEARRRLLRLCTGLTGST